MIVSSRLLTHQTRALARPLAAARTSRRQGVVAARQISHHAKPSSTSSPAFASTSLVIGVVAATSLAAYSSEKSALVAQCGGAPVGAEPVMLSPSKEPATGILFPRLCNGMTLAGCGVRVKWGFVKVSFISALFFLSLFARRCICVHH